ncbi:hypothetical protein NPIRD3C_1398 [Nitrosopumilus piranensis]|uniref:Uncharacterized protein n=1 Tax=Nitrosopumilus piranensis TaxID=1582439 RepID=A0A0C5C021_9ARCH|nr:hypothetical protein NPIRD3C_1398 [Nitrosopumilus piranensis]
MFTNKITAEHTPIKAYMYFLYLGSRVRIAECKLKKHLKINRISIKLFYTFFLAVMSTILSIFTMKNCTLPVSLWVIQ